MATKVTMTLPPILVQSTDIELEVRQDLELLGRLKMSRGGLDWFKKGAKKPTRRATWTELRDWLEG